MTRGQSFFSDMVMAKEVKDILKLKTENLKLKAYDQGPRKELAVLNKAVKRKNHRIQVLKQDVVALRTMLTKIRAESLLQNELADQIDVVLKDTRRWGIK